MLPEEVRGHPAEVSKSGVWGDLQHCLLAYGMFLEVGVADAGSRSASSGGAGPHGNLAVSTGPRVNVFHKMQAITSRHGVPCLVSTYSVSNRMTHFAGNSPTLHRVLMQLLNWKTHSLSLRSPVPWWLGAAECPKLILNLWRAEGTQ